MTFLFTMSAEYCVFGEEFHFSISCFFRRFFFFFSPVILFRLSATVLHWSREQLFTSAAVDKGVCGVCVCVYIYICSPVSRMYSICLSMLFLWHSCQASWFIKCQTDWYRRWRQANFILKVSVKALVITLPVISCSTFKIFICLVTIRHEYQCHIQGIIGLQGQIVISTTFVSKADE